MEKKLTVIETAELLGVSKEAIYNRIRRGSLETIIENGVKYIILTSETKKSSHVKKNNNNVSDAYIQLLKEELQELKEKNKILEINKDKLIKEKETLLIESKEKLEQIYKQRDEQLKTILALATRPTLENKKYNQDEIIVEDNDEDTDTIEADIESQKLDTQKIIDSYSDWHGLRDYLKQKGYSKKEKKIIENEVSKNIEGNDDIKDDNGKIFIKKGKKLRKILKKRDK